MTPIERARRKAQLLMELEIEFPEKTEYWREKLAEAQVSSEEVSKNRFRKLWKSLRSSDAFEELFIPFTVTMVIFGVAWALVYLFVSNMP